ncbi:MAG: tetratricopeptide repeat protein [Sedimentisphaerales bacterium]
MIGREQVDIEHYSPYMNTLIEAICVKRHTITEGRETGNFGYSQQPTSNALKKTLSLLTAGFIIYAFNCYCFQATALSQTDTKLQTTVTASNSKELTAPARSELTPEQEVAVLKKEELELAERLIQDFPNSINPIMLMGNLWERYGDATKALEYFNKVLEQDPERPDIYKSVGWFFMNKEQYEQAIGYWQKALEIDPNIPGVHNNIALALMGQNKQNEAIGELEKDIKISPRSSFSYFLLGQLYLRQKEYEKAGNNYEKAIEIQPNYANAYYGLFTLSARLKQQEKAKEYMTVFKKLKAEDMKILKDRNEIVDDLIDMQKGAAETYLLAGQMYQAGENFQKAEELLKRAITLDPNNILCLEKLASLYLKSNRITEAIPLYRKIGEINPKEPLCHLNIGILSMRLKQMDKAEKAFRKVIEVAPGFSGGYRELAQLYLKTGRGYPEARELAEKAVALEPTALNYFVLSWACDMNGDSENALKAIVRAIQLKPANLKYRNVYEHIKSKN